MNLNTFFMVWVLGFSLSVTAMVVCFFRGELNIAMECVYLVSAWEVLGAFGLPLLMLRGVSLI